MLLKKEREEVFHYCQKLSDAGLTPGTSGNISVLNPRKGLFAISPSGIDYSTLSPEKIPVIDLERKKIEGSLKPSSELDLHLLLYKKREDVRAVIHTHSIFATTFACLKKPIPSVHYMLGTAGIEVPCADYAPFGTEELARKTVLTLGRNNAVLMANHGLLACGESIEKAFATAQNVEYVAEIYYRSLTIGEPKILSSPEMENIRRKFQNYGQ